MQKFRKIIYNILQNNNLYILKTLNYSLERKTVCSALGFCDIWPGGHIYGCASAMKA